MTELRPDSSIDLSAIYSQRFKGTQAKRAAVWKVLVSDYFQRWIPENATVVDIGAGSCDFINFVSAARKYALDLNKDLPQHAGDRVESVVTDVSREWPLQSETVDVCFSSNFLEHLTSKYDVLDCLKEAHRVLKKGGTIILMGPNIRFCYDVYWDYFDHMLPLSDRSAQEVLEVCGFVVTDNVPQFLPFTMQGGNRPAHPLLVRLYLRLPFVWRFFGAQFLIVGKKK